MSPIMIIRQPIPRAELKEHTLEGALVKAVVDCTQSIMAIGGELHADEEQALLEEGSQQRDLWGINLHLDREGEAFLEYDSMINLRPSQGNRTRGVEDPAVRAQIGEIVRSLVLP